LIYETKRRQTNLLIFKPAVMNNYLLKISGLATLVLLLQLTGFAQKSRYEDKGKEKKDTLDNRLNEYDEIVIKRKDNKDAKVTIEIRDGQVLVDGKPVSDYDNDNLSVRKKKIRVMDGSTFTFSGPDGVQGFNMPEMMQAPEGPDVRISPFRGDDGGAWNFSGGDMMEKAANRAFLGVTSQKTESEEGARITEVSKGSAAEKAGLKTGDLITKVDEIRIDGPEALSDAVHKYKPEDKVSVIIKRDGKEQKVTAVLGKAKPMAQAYAFRTPDRRNFNYDFKGMEAPRALLWNVGPPRLGIKAQDTEDGKGVKVLEVDEESAAEKAGIKEGDIITHFDGKEVNSSTALSDMAHASKDKGTIKVSVLRDGKSQELEVRIPKRLKTANL
jgi:serine protease Do